MVDCGLVQGSRSLEALNREPFTFSPALLRAVVLSHAHIDHSGLVPRLVREGFQGPIYCTSGTADLLRQMLPDAGRIQEFDTERRNRRPDRRGDEPMEPIYTEKDALAACELTRSVQLGEWFVAAPGIKARLWNAGHILGSSSIEVVAGETSILFSGDLGPENKSFHPAPGAPVNQDHLVCESTYGDREREDVSPTFRQKQLKAEIEQAIAKGGNLIIPSFALERTQELLLDIAALINSGEMRRVQVFIDSPLASRITAVFVKHTRHLEDLGGTNVFRHSAFHFVETPEQSMRLNDMSGAVILAASGMCEAGRIRHHLVQNLPRHDSTILFVGYQAAGTLGRKILEGAERVRISGRDVNVRARVRRIDSYSAHADRSELLQWIKDRGTTRGTVFLVHGENGALRSLEQQVGAGRTSDAVRIPEIGEVYELPSGMPARRTRTGRDDIREVLTGDWQNDYADFAVQLKSRLRTIKDDATRREVIDRMKRMLEGYADQRHHHH